MKAVEQFTKQVTVPVLYDGEEFDQIGTGTLFTLDDRLFLVTAAHLFDGADPANFSIPNPTTTKLHTLGPYHLFRPKDDAVDIAVLELLDKDTIEHARAGWRSLTLENIGIPSRDGLFALCGYPPSAPNRLGHSLPAVL
jgi:hypothetical protein